MAGLEYQMSNYLFHLRFCRCMYLSVHWSAFPWSIRDGISMPLFLILSCLPRAGLPSVSNGPLLSSANAHGIDISFIIPSKLSLFPSLSFIISTVSSETDYWSLPISLCLSAPAWASWSVSVQGEADRPHFVCSAVSPPRDMPLLTKEQ